MPELVSFRPYDSIMNIDPALVQMFKAGGLFNKSPLNLSSYLPFIRISGKDPTSPTTFTPLELTKTQLENDGFGSASSLNYRGTIAIDDVTVNMYNIQPGGRNTATLNFTAHSPNALYKLRSMFRISSEVQIDFGWSKNAFSINNSDAYNIHNGDGMTAYGMVRHFSIGYNNDLTINVTIEIADGVMYPTSEIDLDYYNLDFFNTQSQGKEFSKIFNNGVSLNALNTSARSEFSPTEYYYSFHYILTKLADTIKDQVTGPPIKIIYSNINSKARCFFYDKDPLTQPMGYFADATIGDIAIPQSILQSLRKTSSTMMDFIHNLLSYINELSEGSLSLMTGLQPDSKTLHIIDYNLQTSVENINILPLVLGSKDSIVKTFSLEAEIGGATADSIIAYGAMMGNVETYVFNKKEIEQYRKFFALGDEASEDSLQIFIPKSKFDVATGISSDNLNSVFVMSKRGIEILNQGSMNPLVPTIHELINLGSLQSLKYAPMKGTIVLRGLSGLSPGNMIRLKGTGMSMWDTVYSILSVKHTISASSWETHLEIVMTVDPSIPLIPYR